MNKIKIKDIFNSNQETIKLSNCDFINYLDTSSITTNRIDNVQYLNVKNDIIPSRAKRNVKKNTIVYSSVRPNLKHYGIIRKPLENMVASTGFVTLDIKDETQNNADYMYYNLTQNKYTDYLHTIACNNVSSYPSINPSDIENMEIEIEPDIDKQKQIAKLFVDIDNKIELNNIINEKLEKLAKTLYEYWFVQFDFPDENKRPYKSSGGTMVYNEVLRQEIPLGWSVNNVKSCITHINTGLNPRDNFILNNGDIKYITVKNLTTHGGIDFSNCDTIDEVAQKIVHKRSDISKGDILFASIAPLGRCYLIQEEPQTWDINESVFSIRPKNTMPSEYMYIFLMSETFVKKAENSSTGSVFAGIRIKTLEDMLLVIPDNKILQLFKEKTSKILLQKHIKECENQELTTIRDFLLPMLMNGQVVIQ